MPTYEYVCEAGHEFEAVQSIKDEPLRTCPQDKFSESNTCALGICNAPVKRLISKTSFILKGKGWFKDGY